MAYKSFFSRNQLYDQNDINGRLMRLTTDGVLNIDNDPNNILSQVATGGVAVTEQKCKVTKVNENTVKIGAGTVFISDGGSVDIVDEMLYNVDISGDTYTYIYVDRDILTDEVKPMFGKTLPETAVPLARCRYGMVGDYRRYAKMKNSSLLPNTIFERISEYTVYEDTEFTSSIQLDKTGYTKIWFFVGNGAGTSSSSNPIGSYLQSGTGLIEIQDDGSQLLSYVGEYGYSKIANKAIPAGDITIKVELSESKDLINVKITPKFSTTSRKFFFRVVCS